MFKTEVNIQFQAIFLFSLNSLSWISNLFKKKKNIYDNFKSGFYRL